VRNLLDSEAQPDKCSDTIWLMGVPHPGYRPPISPGASSLDVGDEDSRSESTPPPIGREREPRLAGWQRRRDQGGIAGPTSPPPKGIGQLFSGSTLSLVSSPSKDNAARSEVESPSAARKSKEKELIKWPDQCEFVSVTESAQLMFQSTRTSNRLYGARTDLNTLPSCRCLTGF
jgi:cysteine protease ATG4